MTLREQHCKPCEGGTPPLSPDDVARFREQVPGWEPDKEGLRISRRFSFDSYWAGVGFVNAVAWIAQSEKHHPDVELGYKTVRVAYSTHAIGGLSENDFISAAKVDALLQK